MGYVGLSLSILLSQKYKVVALDTDSDKIDLINKNKSPIHDYEIENFLSDKDLDLDATTEKKHAYKNSKYVIIAVPTNYDASSDSFDTTIVERVIADTLTYNSSCNIVIKSTIPLGFTERMKIHFKKNEIFFSPEFLREGKALYDNLYPSRIVVGDTTKEAIKFSKILAECSYLPKEKIKIHSMKSSEAEAVKLFSNTHLAMRISFFNELDTFAEAYNFSAKKIISAVCDDARIGNYYNNPSFGYGGYCLPKDTKQLLANYQNIPTNLIKAVIDSNQTRKSFIANSIIKKKPKSVGIYRLAMKTDSDNFRESAVLDLIKILKKERIKIYLYEPLLSQNIIKDISLINNLEEFKAKSDLIVANRLSEDLKNVDGKVYTRDLFQEN